MLSSAFPAALVIARRRYAREWLLPALVRSGFSVSEVEPRDRVVASLTALAPELVILVTDVEPGVETILDEVGAHSTAAVIVLAPHRDQEFAAGCLLRGADVVAADSDGHAVLDAQIHAVARRTRPFTVDNSASRFDFRELSIDVGRHRVTVGGNAVGLTEVEFRILTMLILNAGRVVTPTEMVSTIFGPGEAGKDVRNFAKVHIARLRRKLEETGASPGWLRNVRGVGYICDPPAPA